jgi:hypothetical protein
MGLLFKLTRPLLLLLSLLLLQAQTQFVDNETPHGVIDGVNTLFFLSYSPNPPTSLHVYRNGLHLQPRVEYIVIENRLRFVPHLTQTGDWGIPQRGDALLASYRH